MSVTQWIKQVAEIDVDALKAIIECSGEDDSKMYPGHIYCGKTTFPHVMYKIGKTYNIDQRERQHNNQMLGGFTLVHSVLCCEADYAEKAFHYLFDACRWTGRGGRELFQLPSQDLKWMCSLRYIDGEYILNRCIDYLDGYHLRRVGNRAHRH